MLVGDLGIGLLSGRLDWMLYPDQAFVYVAMALMIASGLLLRRTRSWAAIAGAGLGSSVMFFVLTNFGVWLVGDNPRYTHDLPGLVQCYTLALPFFRNTLISMALFSALLFSPIAVTALKPAWQPVPSLE
jgi:hypothetical protein